MLNFESYASGSKGNLNTLSDGETSIMLDCGLPWKQVQKALRFKTSEFSGVCLTHSHQDHSTGIDGAMKAGQDIYLLPETRDALGLSGHRIHGIELLHQFRIGAFQVKAFPLKHDVPNCGFLFANSKGERAVYVTDTPYIPYRFDGLTHLMIGCNYELDILRDNVGNKSIPQPHKNRVMRSHMGLDTFKEFLRVNDLSRLKETWLLHLSGSNSDAELFKSEAQKITGKPVFIA